MNDQIYTRTFRCFLRNSKEYWVELGKRHGVVVLSISTIFVLLLGMVPLSAYAGINNAQEPEFALKCYNKSSGTDVDPPSTPFQDQFQSKNVDPNPDQRYCVEALKHSDQPPPNPRYWIEFEDDTCPNCLNPGKIEITDQFAGKFTTNLFHFELLVPASGTASNSPDNLVQGLVNNQDYSGYSPSFSPPSPIPNTPIMVTDQFGTSMITLDSAFAFEAIAIVGSTQGLLVGQDLMCYMFMENQEVNPIDPPAFNPATIWVTQFGTNTINDLSQADVLCVMADKTPPTPRVSAIGGDIVPLDSTMVLAAGAQYTAAWMIPVIVSAIGIGIVIARKF